MRADRLVATLLFLQTRGRVTVAEVAAELDVSPRTARRDLEALALAGVPVYSRRGRGGGWSLVGGARTNLTGLTADEIRALFLLAGPLSSTAHQRTALRKLVRALPASLRQDAEAAARAGHVDGHDWSRTASTAEAPQLDVVRRAVVEGVQVRIGYQGPGRPATERTVHPLGLASKAGADYLVADTHHGMRVFRLSRITAATRTGDPVVRPEGFDLATTWRALAARMEDRMRAVTVRATAAADTEAVLRRLFGDRLRVLTPRRDTAIREGTAIPQATAIPGAVTSPEAGTPPDERASGWLAVEVDGPSSEVLAAQLAGLGGRIEVLDPPEARHRLARIAAELASLYGLPGVEGALSKREPPPTASFPEGPTPKGPTPEGPTAEGPTADDSRADDSTTRGATP
ncbi:WYL domain-containing protein [Streptomyces sp. NPDC049954]|uniref:helix-turn-helix transcriptional regulator n=1 Tax=Streptomyces sp. NPDC049954 TaxID=3155779 RepID=UPI0034400AB8